MAVETVDVDAMTPEDFAALVKRSSDSDLPATIAQAGEERVLERVFSTIPERLKAPPPVRSTTRCRSASPRGTRPTPTA